MKKMSGYVGAIVGATAAALAFGTVTASAAGSGTPAASTTSVTSATAEPTLTIQAAGSTLPPRAVLPLNRAMTSELLRPTDISERALGPDLARGFMLLFIALANSHYFFSGSCAAAIRRTVRIWTRPSSG